MVRLASKSTGSTSGFGLEEAENDITDPLHLAVWIVLRMPRPGDRVSVMARDNMPVHVRNRLASHSANIGQDV